MVGNTKETVNSFNGGINCDIDDSLIPKNQYRDALNMRVVASRDNSASTLQPYTGFEEKLNYEEVDDYTIISTISVRNYIVTFKTTTDLNTPLFIIDRYDTLKNKHVEILNNDHVIIHGYNSNSKFSCVARYEDSDNIKVYWADGVNPIRSINISDSAQDYNGTITNVDQFNIKPLFNQDKPKFKGFGNGSLLSGKIQYAYYFYNKNGQQTEVSVPSKLISLTTSNDDDNSYFNIKGDKLNENTNKSCIIEFDTSSGEYQRAKIISIHYDDNASTPKIRLVGDIKLENVNTTTFIDFGTNVLAEYTVDEFNLIAGINFSAKYIESKNNYLFAGNISKIDWDVDYDARAYRANLAGYVRLMSSQSTTPLDFLLQIDDNFNTDAVVPANHDCINPYNDLNKDYDYFVDRSITQETSPGSGDWFYNSYLGVPLEDTDKYQYIFENNVTYYAGDEKHNHWGNTKYGGLGPNIKYEFIWSEIELDEDTSPEIWENDKQLLRSSALKTQGAITVLKHLSKKSFEGMWHYDQDGSVIHSKNIDGGVELKDRFCNYSNTYISSKYQSLHRDELYRYGIVFYNKYGVKSTVKWIGDIRTPKLYDTPKILQNGSFQPFATNELISFKSNGDLIRTGLKARPLGIRFTVGNISELISSDVVAYEIVRVKKTINDKSILSQGYISKVFYNNNDIEGKLIRPYTIPLFYTTDTSASPGAGSINIPFHNEVFGGSENIQSYETNPLYAKNGVLQFVSPDTTYSKDSFYDSIKKSNIYFAGINLLSSVQTIDTDTLTYQVDDYTKSGIFASTNFGLAFAPYSINSPMKIIGKNKWTAFNAGVEIDKLFSDAQLIASPSIHLAKYYTQKTINSELTLPSTYDFLKNTSIILDIAASSDFDYNNRMGFPSDPDSNDNPTTLGGISVYNYNFDDRLNMTEAAGKVAQGPSSPSLYILEDASAGKYISGSFYSISNSKIISNRQSKTDTFLASLNVKDRNHGIDIIINPNMYQGNPMFCRYSIFNSDDDPIPTSYDHFHSFNDMLIVNMKQLVSPFGGNTYQSRQYSTYTSIGCINKIDDSKIKPKYYKENTSVIDTFNGDTFLCVFDNQRTHTLYTLDFNEPEAAQRKSVNFRLPLETYINLDLTNGPEIHRNNSFDIQINPCAIRNGYTQTEPLYQYNSAYSAISDVVINTVKNELDEPDKKLDTRIVYSEQKINDEIQDSWTIFKSNNFLEVDNRYGALTNLKLFKNQLLAFQENAVSLLSVKERSILQDGNIGGLVLGTGDILERYDYFTTNYGIAPDQSKSIIDTESALYWFDHYRNQILSYNGQLELLSKKKYIQSYLNTHNIKPYPISVYNRELNDVMFNLFTDDKPTIAFNEQIDAFSSFYSIDYLSGNNVNGKLYLFKDNYTIDVPHAYKVIQYSDNNTVNEFLDGKKHKSSITYVVNEGYDQTKIFDNVEFNGMYPFTSTSIKYNVDGKDTYTIDSSDIENRELTYKYAIPRVISGEEIPDRVRGNATTCTFTITPDGKLFRIPYFKTKFRTSKS